MAAQRILVADDDEAVCDTIEDALHLAGYLTMRARDGQMALDRVRNDRPDLVILDVNMPKVDGFEVLRKMRSLSITTPAILLTARHEREDTVTGLKLGADDYVKKLKVTALKRVRIGSVVLGGLPLGQWRYLRGDERV